LSLNPAPGPAARPESAQQAYANARAIGDRRIEVDALNTLAEVAIADANITDADGFLTAAYTIGSAIAYDLGIRDARKARRALDLARETVKVPPSRLLARWSRTGHRSTSDSRVARAPRLCSELSVGR
jgi:hypothetical protein